MQPFESTTERLPRRLAHPLKPSRLEAALRSLPACPPVVLRRQASGALLQVTYYAPRHNIPAAYAAIQTGAVPVERAHEARRLVENELIPQLLDWLAFYAVLTPDMPLSQDYDWIGWHLPDSTASHPLRPFRF